MKFLKYPAMLIGLGLIIIVFFWDDLKSIYTKFSNKMQVQFHSNTNNPFNIKANAANKWNGKTTKQGATFESFDRLENGVRAGIKILKTYFEKYNIETVQGIITRFAPSTENNTAGYIKFVCREMGVTETQRILPDKETLWKLSKAICKMENGYELSKESFEAGYGLL